MEVFEYLPEFCKDWFDYYEPDLVGQLNIGQYWFFLIVFLVIYLIYEELSFNQPKKSHKKSSNDKIIDDILNKLRLNHIADVNWRRSLLVSLLVSFILSFFLFYPFEIPPGFVYFFLNVIIFGVVYFTTAWISSHWWKMNGYKIEKSLLKFRDELKCKYNK